MKLRFVLTLICLTAPLLSVKASACANHMYLNPNDYGMVGGAMLRLAGLAAPEPVFDLQYTPMASSVIGESNEIVVNYSRPFFADDVRLELKGTSNVELSADYFALEKRSGAVRINYKLTDSGFDRITLTVIGEHRGKTVREVGQIYLRGAQSAPGGAEKVQLTQR